MTGIRTIGVIGAGQMGNGIAHVCALAGFDVILNDISAERLEAGIKTIQRNMDRQVHRQMITADARDAALRRLRTATSLNEFADVDFAIEAATEKENVKRAIFDELCPKMRKDAIVATNTSSISITRLGASTDRPERFIGLHFFSPANVMKLLEIVRADHTSKSVIATSMKLAKQIGKIAALVGVCPGFVGNRILAQRQREAQKLVMEGAMPWDIDRVLYDFGFPMGPFAMSDLAGLDIGWVKERSKGESIRDVLCEMDRRGQKTGAGYYDYDENRNAKPSPVTEKVIRYRCGVDLRLWLAGLSRRPDVLGKSGRPAQDRRRTRKAWRRSRTAAPRKSGKGRTFLKMDRRGAPAKAGASHPQADGAAPSIQPQRQGP